jgi:5-methylthioadenosine/S-adenosylhomocysteine deaminase
MKFSNTPFSGRRSLRRAFFVCALALFLPALAVRGANILAEDFTTLTATALPAGWTSSIASGLAYTAEPFVGAAPNAYKFAGTGQWLASPAFDAGATNVQFWAYGNAGAGSTIAVSGLVSGVWTLAGTATIALNDGTYNVALDPQTTQIKFTFTKVVNCAFDDVAVQGTAGPSEDPNLTAPATLAFGTVSAGTVNTQTLALANSGATLTLHLTSLSPVGGDTNKFTVGAIPAALAPGISTNIRVVYAPGAVTGVSHSATYRLITDDPSTPTNSIVFSGATAGGTLTISNVQYSVSGASPEAGNRVYVNGIATYADPSGYAISDAGGGPWSGIYVMDPYHRPNLGDRVYLEGLVQEFASLTTLTNITRYSIAGTNQTVPITTIRGNQVASEDYEGVLVAITNVTVKNTNLSGRAYWQAGDSAGNFPVATRAPYRYIWTNNARLTAIQGLVFTNYVSPRFDADFIGRPMFEYALRGLVMTPDGPRTNWTVHVRDDVIVAVTNVAIPGVTNVTTGGIIYPGLIDAHNHPGYNSFPTLMFNDFPFGHRDAWGTNTEYVAWKAVRTTLRSASSDSSNDDIQKYGECLELMAGCIAIQGQSNIDPEHDHADVILFNMEQFPARTWQDIFPWESTTAERTNLLAKIAGGSVNAAMIHLCEGTDSVARAQFATWTGWGMLNRATTIIHGAALQASDFAQMAAVGAKMVWSPMSNMKLYGGTANVKAAKTAGVLVGISPDWTPSGCFNILEELGYAWRLNTTIFSNAYTAREMCDMVTINNAICAGLESHYGKIAVGYNAGLAVIEGDTADPYMALINARPAQVLLTIVDGTPRYGEPALMTALGVTGESVDIRGRAKKMNIAFVHPFLDYSTRTFATMRANLQTAHGTLAPTGELDSEELQFLDIPLLETAGDNVAPFRADNPISAAPGTAVYDQGTNLTVSFRYQDFWDNDTFITNLTHTISIVPARYSNLVLQTIATNRANTPANQTVNFTVGFQDMHTNYMFAFATRDAQGNVRTTYTTNTFKLAYHTGGDSDHDGMSNEWEIAYFGSFTGAVASANADGDRLNNYEEYVADTIPTSSTSCFSAIDFIDTATVGTMQIQSPVPTSPRRVYDVWWTTNLLGAIVWHPVGLNVPGAAGGTSVVLRVTNTFPGAVYRAGVKLP